MHLTPVHHLALHRVRWWTRWREAQAAHRGLWCTVAPWGQDDDGDTDGYATTGWLPAHDDATWAAFAVLAPHVLDADVMADAGCVVVEIADQGTSLALRLTAEHRRLRPLR